MKMRILLVLLLSLPVLCQAESGVPWDVRQLMQALSVVKESKARFVERKSLSILNRPLESSGTLVFAAPAHLEKRTLTPKVETLLLDQGVLTIDMRNTKRTLVLQEYPAVWAFVESIRSTLAGDLPTLERFYQIELEGDAAHWKLRLLPTQQTTRDAICEIRISGHANRVESIETLEPNGDHSIMKVMVDTP
jgi:hypothetical protein